MEPLRVGDPVPEIPGLEATEDPSVVFFYKVTCPTCQLVAPVAERLHRRFPERFVGVGQDPREKLEQFAEDLGGSWRAVPDAPPYPISDAFGVRTVPTLFVIEDGTVRDVAESWDRDSWNRLAATLAERAGTDAEELSHEGDGLPPFRPG